MRFSQALEELIIWRRVARKNWNGKGMWIAIQRHDNNSKMTLPYIYMSTISGDLVPWVASQTDILANDWEIVGT